jgi:hypothetical protein
VARPGQELLREGMANEREHFLSDLAGTTNFKG